MVGPGQLLGGRSALDFLEGRASDLCGASAVVPARVWLVRDGADHMREPWQACIDLAVAFVSFGAVCTCYADSDGRAPRRNVRPHDAKDASTGTGGKAEPAAAAAVVA